MYTIINNAHFTSRKCIQPIYGSEYSARSEAKRRVLNDIIDKGIGC